MPDSTAGARRTFQFSATTVEGLREELNDFAAMIQTNLQTDKLTTKMFQWIPIKGPVYRRDADLGMQFLRKREFDSKSSVMMLLVQPDSTNEKILKGFGAVTAAKDANGDSVAGGLQP